MVYIPAKDFAENLTGEGDYRNALAEAAESAKPIAEANARRIRPYNAEAMEVQVDDAGVRLVNTDYGAIIDEFGTVTLPPSAALRRAVQTVGFRLEEAPKP